MRNENEKFCHNCGAKIDVNAELCPQCGVRQPAPGSKSASQQEQQNKWIITLILCWFLGVFGVHRFYTGYVGIGIIQLLTLGGCGIWTRITSYNVCYTKLLRWGKRYCTSSIGTRYC